MHATIQGWGQQQFIFFIILLYNVHHAGCNGFFQGLSNDFGGISPLNFYHRNSRRCKETSTVRLSERKLGHQKQ